MSFVVVIAFAAVSVTLLGGLLAYSFRASQNLGGAIAEIEELESKIEWMEAALHARSAASPSLDELVFAIQEEDDSSSA